MSEHRISLIGCGMMGSAMAKGLAREHTLFIFDHHPEKVEQGTVCASPKEAIEESDIIILAVKPHDVEALANEIYKETKGKKLLVSLLGGVSVEKLKSLFPKVPILRMMPNIPVATGDGVVGLVESEELSKEEIEEIFRPLGLLYWVPERKIDALTALTGSGPAFVCVMLEAMIEAGIKMGFKPEEAKELSYALLEGVVATLKETKGHPAELKWQVASPGGITIEGIQAMEEHAVRAGIMKGFLAAFSDTTSAKGKKQQ